MLIPLSCHWYNESSEIRKNRLQQVIEQLELRENKPITIFDEATQTSANFLQTPLAILGIVDEDEYVLKSSYGLTNLGTNNYLLRNKKIRVEDSFSIHVIDSRKPLAISNTFQDSFFCTNSLVQEYQIRSYLGIPLITSGGECIGCLEVFDFKNRQFSATEINFLNLTARWCMAEYERSVLANKISLNKTNQISGTMSPQNSLSTEKASPEISKAFQNIEENPQYPKNLSIKLLNKLIQKISIPLTSIIGMSSVLKQGVYGKVNEKQLEYLGIIHNSGQEITTLLDEIVSLGAIEENKKLDLKTVDIAILGEQIITSLQNSAQAKQNDLILFVEPGETIWLLDREKFKQSLYYILTTIIENARSGSEIQIHISHQLPQLKINILVKHSWLSDGISPDVIDNYLEIIQQYYDMDLLYVSQEEIKSYIQSLNQYNYELITLLFSCYLVDLQGGKITLQGTPELGYRFVINLPLAQIS